MFHLSAYTLAALGNTADTDIPALTDDVLLIQNSHFVPANNLNIVAAQVMSATLNRVKLVQPTLRQITTPFIRPIVRGAIPVDLAGVADYRQNPLVAYGQEELAMQATSGVAMTERFYGLVWLCPRWEIPAPRAPFLLRGTSTTAATTGAWTTLTTTWQDTPRSGNYQVTGLLVQSTNAVASRLIFEDQVWRPGAPSITAINNQASYYFLYGNMGVYGRFNAYRPPVVQVLANGADATHEIYLEISRID